MGVQAPAPLPLWRLWVRVVEGRHVTWRGAESRLVVRTGRVLQAGQTRKAASSPYYGEEFTFELRESLEDLLEKTVTLSVQQARNLIPRNKTLASTVLELAVVWAQPGHQVVHKWAALWSDSTEGPAGFLLVDMALLGRGDSLRRPLLAVHSSHIEEYDFQLLMRGQE